MPTLFLIRHGTTQWTEAKRFAGWGDAPLSDRGRDQVLSAANSIKKSGHSFDVCFTSQLTRAKSTATTILSELGMSSDVLKYDWRLNERHYGALEGELRSLMVKKYGYSKVREWRNNYRACPPELEDDDPRWIEQLKRFPEIPLQQHPRSESMAQAVARTRPLWTDEVTPALKSGKSVMVIAHTNSIRSLVGSIEGLNEAQCGVFRISTATPRHYTLGDDFKPLDVQDLTDKRMVKIRHWFIRKMLKFLSKF